jgi:hypothetical protein
MPHRVDYPIKIIQAKMKALNFPARLIERLDYGR